MGARRYFQTTRGRIVADLRKRVSATANELAETFGISANAVRQHLTALVREGVVSETSARRGPTKPTLEYTLTPAADALFPQQYDRLLNAVLREVREASGDAGVEAIFDRIAQRVLDKHALRLQQDSPAARVESVASILREQGVQVTVEQPTSDVIVMSEHNCPFSHSVAAHPEVCGVVHSMLDQAAPNGYRQTRSIAQGERSCRFEIDIPVLTES